MWQFQAKRKHFSARVGLLRRSVASMNTVPNRPKALAIVAEGNALGALVRKLLRPERAFQKRGVDCPFRAGDHWDAITEGVALDYDGGAFQAHSTHNPSGT